MNVGGVDVQVWSKNQDLTYKTSADETSQAMTNNGVPAEAIEVNAPTYTFKATANQSLYFYLKIWKTGSKTTVNPDVTTSSLNKKMLALEGAIRPTGVPTENEVTIIGCEDATDNDYEDLVFLIYGKPTPPIVPTDEIEITETKMTSISTTLLSMFRMSIRRRSTCNQPLTADGKSQKEMLLFIKVSVLLSVLPVVSTTLH